MYVYVLWQRNHVMSRWQCLNRYQFYFFCSKQLFLVLVLIYYNVKILWKLSALTRNYRLLNFVELQIRRKWMEVFNWTVFLSNLVWFSMLQQFGMLQQSISLIKDMVTKKCRNWLKNKSKVFLKLLHPLWIISKKFKLLFKAKPFIIINEIFNEKQTSIWNAMCQSSLLWKGTTKLVLSLNNPIFAFCPRTL